VKNFCIERTLLVADVEHDVARVPAREEDAEDERLDWDGGPLRRDRGSDDDGGGGGGGAVRARPRAPARSRGRAEEC